MTLTPESAYYAMQSPVEQRRALLEAIIVAAGDSSEDFAADLVDEAADYLEELA